MAKNLSADIFEVTKGGPWHMSGAADPRAGAGVAAPVASMYMRTGATPDWFFKSSVTDTDWMPLLANGATGFFGDGSDGNLTVAGATNEGSTTGGDVYYNNLSITGAGTYRPQGRRILVLGTLNITAGGVFTINGSNAAGAVGGAATVGYLTNAGTLGGTGNTGNGGNGTNTAVIGIPAGAATGVGGVGGTGNGGASTGGAGGTITASTVNGSMRQSVLAYTGFSTMATQAGVAPGTGGGGGGGNGAASNGGGGGGGAGTIILVARQIINNGTISANGGAGANGTAANCGGGGGGGGGRVLLIFRSYTGAGTITANAGSPGASGGGNGTPGNSGAAGLVLMLPV